MQPDSPSSAQTFEIGEGAQKIDELIQQWKSEKDAVTARREVRTKKIDLEKMRRDGELGADEIFIARRIIDKNIRQEKPAKLAYIEQAPRLVLFKSRSDAAKDTIPLADFFTDGMRYTGWNVPWHRLIDGTSLHGGCALEVRVDTERAFSVAIEYVPREDLIFPAKLRNDLQKCEMILRRYEYLPSELEEFVDLYEFDKDVVRNLCTTSRYKRDEPIEVYKVFRRRSDDGIVEVGWYAPNYNQKWLKDFDPLLLGHVTPQAQPIPSTVFPFVFDLYELLEEECLLAVKGRAFRDLADQDALSQLWTAMVNGANCAASIERSYVNNPAAAESTQAETYKRGTIHGRELKQFQAAYPDAILLQVANQLSTTNMADSGRVDFAVSNRKDARKTRAEILTSKEQQQELSSVNVVPFSITIVRVYSMVWDIVRSQILAGLIQVPPHILKLAGDSYDIAAAGSVEVIQRDEEISALEGSLSLFMNTPLGPEMMARYIELRFPQHAARWKHMLLAGTDLRPIVAQILQLFSSVKMDQLPPNLQQPLLNLLEAANRTLAAGQPADMAGGPSNAPTNPADQIPV